MVSDPRLGRLKQFDERSREYPIAPLLAAKGQPRRSYTWRCNARLDQGNIGACVGFSLIHEVIARPKEYTKLGRSDAMFIYREAQKIDPWPGEAYEGTSVLAGAKILQRKGYIDEYRWAFSTDDLALAVSRWGPAVIGINWYDGMFNTDPAGFVHPTGQKAGGHAILVNGYNDRLKEFRLVNSWGTNWGKDGTCKINYDDMNRLLQEDGEALVLVKRNPENA